MTVRADQIEKKIYESVASAIKYGMQQARSNPKIAKQFHDKVASIMSSFNSKIIRKQMSDDLKKRLAQLNAVINAGQQSAQRKLPIGPKDLVAHVEGWDTFKSTVGTFFRLAVVANQYGSLYADVKKIKGRDAYSWTVEAIDIELHEESMSGEEETLAQAKCTAVCKMGEVMQDFAQSRGLHARIDWSKVHDVK